MGTLTVAPAIGFKTAPQYLFVRALAFCDPWLQLADEPKTEIFNHGCNLGKPKVVEILGLI